MNTYYSFVLSGFVCVLYVSEVKCQCSDATKPLTLTASSSPQYVESPNYPADYPSDSDCDWLITASDPSLQIIINIESFETEGTAPCQYDFLAVHDGVDNTADEVTRLCMTNADDTNELVSSTDNLFLHFESDGWIQYSGFKVLYFEASAASQPGCSASLTATSTAQVLMSQTLPSVYASDTVCNYTITTATQYYGTRVTLNFMDIETSASCANDYLSVSEVGSDGSVNEVYKGCTRATTYDFDSIEAVADSVSINFNTDSAATNFYGFMLTYEEVFKGLNLTEPLAAVSLTVAEDLALSSQLNSTEGVIVVTATATLQFVFLLRDVNGLDVVTTQFAVSAADPSYYLTVASPLDYEASTSLTLIVTMVSSDVPLLTYTATFSITVTDVDDVAPAFTNLPVDVELTRSKTSGFVVHTVSATDGDSTPAYQTIVFEISSGDTYDILAINDTTGVVTVTSLVSSTVPLAVTSYPVTISAYSGTTLSSLVTNAVLNITIPPDSPPVCTSGSVWADLIDVTADAAGKVLTYPTEWNCTDEYDIVYSIASVTPTPSPTLFAIDSATSAISLLRTFTVLEVPNRIFSIALVATDTLGQTTTVTVSANVTALACYPNPRPLYARMDQDVGSLVLSDFNCTSNVGLTYTFTQYPTNTFELVAESSGAATIILKSPVYKLRFYSARATIFDGVDTVELQFRVTIQTPRCDITVGDSIRRVPNIAVLLCCSIVCFIVKHMLP